MIEWISGGITKYFKNNNGLLTEQDLLKINYSLQVIIGDTVKLMIIFCLFFLLNELPIFTLSLIILITTRPLWGGIHCKTFNTCLFVSMIYFLTILLFSKCYFEFSNKFYIVMFIITFIIISVYAPCRNKKRPIINRLRLKIFSIISLSCWTIIFFRSSNMYIRNCIYMSILFQLIQIIIINGKVGIQNAKIYKFFLKYIN